MQTCSPLKLINIPACWQHSNPNLKLSKVTFYFSSSFFSLFFNMFKESRKVRWLATLLRFLSVRGCFVFFFQTSLCLGLHFMQSLMLCSSGDDNAGGSGRRFFICFEFVQLKCHDSVRGGLESHCKKPFPRDGTNGKT